MCCMRLLGQGKYCLACPACPAFLSACWYSLPLYIYMMHKQWRCSASTFSCSPLMTCLLGDSFFFRYVPPLRVPVVIVDIFSMLSGCPSPFFYAAVFRSVHEGMSGVVVPVLLLPHDSCGILRVLGSRVHYWCQYALPFFNNKGYVAKPLCPSSLLCVTISSLLTYPPVVMRLTSKSLASKVLLALMSVLAESLLTLMGSHLVALLLLTVWHNTFLFKG